MSSRKRKATSAKGSPKPAAKRLKTADGSPAKGSKKGAKTAAVESQPKQESKASSAKSKSKEFKKPALSPAKKGKGTTSKAEHKGDSKSAKAEAKAAPALNTEQLLTQFHRLCVLRHSMPANMYQLKVTNKQRQEAAARVVQELPLILDALYELTESKTAYEEHECAETCTHARGSPRQTAPAPLLCCMPFAGQVCLESDEVMRLRACGHATACYDCLRQDITLRIGDGDVVPWFAPFASSVQS